VDEVGGPDARGFTVNVPLPGATGDAGYLAAFERVVVPILTQFQPELILVSAGQDANIYDPLGRMMLSSNAYRVMTRLLRQVAEINCDGRLVICHEGGYSTVYVPFCTLAIIEELCGTRSGVADPFIPSIEIIPTVTLVQPEATRAIERAVACQAAFWTMH
jgi:acetoin utilization deacetylase AcuC-like enzyme